MTMDSAAKIGRKVEMAIRSLAWDVANAAVLGKTSVDRDVTNEESDRIVNALKAAGIDPEGKTQGDEFWSKLMEQLNG